MGILKAFLKKICVGANRDEVYSNIERFIELRDKRQKENPKVPIVEIKTMEMLENKGEIDKIIEHWKNSNVWISKKRLISWGR